MLSPAEVSDLAGRVAALQQWALDRGLRLHGVDGAPPLRRSTVPFSVLKLFKVVLTVLLRSLVINVFNTMQAII